jgi:hypothetical protein
LWLVARLTLRGLKRNGRHCRRRWLLDLIAQVQAKCSLDKTQAQRDVDAFAKGRQLSFVRSCRGRRPGLA